MIDDMIDETYINMLRTRNKQSIDGYLENFKRLKNTVLNLDGDIYNITKLPEEIKTYDWCTTMIVDGTILNTIDIFPPNITKLNICNNKKLKKLDASLIPKSVLQLQCTKNKIEEIFGLNEGIIDLILAYNEFKIIQSPIPKSVVNLDISCNPFLENFPEMYNNGENIHTIKANGTSVISIDDLHDNIVIIQVCKTNIFTINKLPSRLTEFKAFHGSIEEINCEIPESIVIFDVYNNKLNVCPRLGKNIKDVDLGKNYLKILPDVSVEAESKFDIDRNDDIKIDDIRKFAQEHPSLTIIHSKYKHEAPIEPQIDLSAMINIGETTNNSGIDEDLTDSVDVSDINIERFRLFHQNQRQFQNRNPFTSMFSSDTMTSVRRQIKPDKYKVKLTKTFKL